LGRNILEFSLPQGPYSVTYSNLLSRKFSVTHCARLPNYLKIYQIYNAYAFLNLPFNSIRSQILHFHFNNNISNVQQNGKILIKKNICQSKQSFCVHSN
jgi:hypothetical protein